MLSNAIWLFVIIFMLHDFEEIITVENWAKRTESKVKIAKRKIDHIIWNFWNVNSHSFAKRDVYIFLSMSLITLTKIFYMESAWSSALYISFLLFVFLHNLAHILQTLIMKSYTPGLYSSIILVFPYTIYLLLRVF